MGLRMSIAFIFLLGLLLMVSDVIAMQTYEDDLATEIEKPDPAVQNEKLCALCEEYTALAVDYLNQNRTQTQIIDSLHKACSNLHNLEQQCLLLVDYYAPLFFTEVDLISPEKFCKKIKLCEGSIFIPKSSDEACSVCHQAVLEVLLKLKDPDNQLEIITALLKACNKMENLSKQCKRLVFEYGPVILVNVEKFLEATDICTYIHACKTSSESMIIQVHDSQVALSEMWESTVESS